jgi:Calcineurin-like phosphoesterase
MKINYKLNLPLFLILSLFGMFNLNAQNKIKIAIWGDSRENLDGATDNISDVLLNKITDWDFQIHTGDLTHDGSTQAWLKSLNNEGIKRLFVKDKFLLCTSNHEFKDAYGKANWNKYTAGILPVNSADSTTHFYSFDKGNVHVICLDGYVTDKYVMQNWLDNDLAAVKKDNWLLAVWHNPAYGDLSYKESYLETCFLWLKSLYKHGCSFIVNGHAHVYIRTKALTPDEKIDYNSGIVHIVNGTGGASWKEAVVPNKVIEYTPSEKSFPCITFLTIEGEKAHLQTIDARPESKMKMIDEAFYEKLLSK